MYILMSISLSIEEWRVDSKPNEGWVFGRWVWPMSWDRSLLLEHRTGTAWDGLHRGTYRRVLRTVSTVEFGGGTSGHPAPRSSRESAWEYCWELLGTSRLRKFRSLTLSISFSKKGLPFEPVAPNTQWNWHAFGSLR